MFDVKVLKALPKDTEPDRVAQLYAQGLAESPWGFWSTLKFVKDPHVAAALKAIEKKTDDIEPALVRAGWKAAQADGVRAAGAFFAFVATSTNLRGLSNRLKRDRAKLAAVEPFAAEAVEAVLEEKHAPDTLRFWSLVYLLMLDAKRHASLLTKVQASSQRWGDPHGVFAWMSAHAATA